MKLYVGNLSYETKESSLQELFGGCGPVKEVKLITDRNTDRSKGFAFVEMENQESGEKAIQELNGKELDGRALKVSVARPPEKKSFSRERSYSSRRY